MPGDTTRYNVPFVAPALPNATPEYSQMAANETNRTLRIYFNQIDKALRTQNSSSTIDLAEYGGSPDASAAINTAAIEAAWAALVDVGGKILLNNAGTWSFNNSVFAATGKPIEICAVDGVLVFPGNPQTSTWMWDFEGVTKVTQPSFNNIRVSGGTSGSRASFLGIRVGRSNNLTAYKCFGRFVDGTAWQFMRAHNSEIDITTFECGRTATGDANRFAMMITGYYSASPALNDVFNDIRLDGTSEKDYHGWLVEGGTILRSVNQIKIHGSDHSQRGFQLHRVGQLDISLLASQRFLRNGFIHISDAATTSSGSSPEANYNNESVTLLMGQGNLNASLPVRGTIHLNNATNLEIQSGAANNVVDSIVLNLSAAKSGVKCVGLLTPQTASDVAAGNFANGIQYRISDLGSAGNAAWVTYTGVSATYKVGDFFTGTSNNSALLTSAVVTRRYAMVGLTGAGAELARPYIGELGQTTQVFDQFLRDSRTDSGRELIQEFLPSLDAAKIEQFGSQTPRFRITRLFGQRTSNPPATFDRKGQIVGSDDDIISLERGGLKTGGIGVETSLDTYQEATFIDSSYELAETVNAGSFVTGQRYSISNVGSAGNAAWITYLGARPGGGNYDVGDLFIAPGNGSALTDAQAKIYHIGSGLSFDKDVIYPRRDQARAHNVVQLGTPSISFSSVAVGGVQILGGAGDPSAGSGTSAPQGSMFLRTDGGTSTTLYVKTGSGNTNWTAK